MIQYNWDKRGDLENVDQDILKEHFPDIFEFWNNFKRSELFLEPFIKNLD